MKSKKTTTKDDGLMVDGFVIANRNYERKQIAILKKEERDRLFKKRMLYIVLLLATYIMVFCLDKPC